MSAKDDVRVSAVSEAVSFWNTEFLKLGSPFRLGAITHIIESIPFEDLRPFANRSSDELRPLLRWSNGSFDFDFPASIRRVNGDVIVALSDGKFNSFTVGSRVPRKILVAIESLPRLLKLPNGAPNVIAHEFGHVVGLGHNNDSAALMCGGSPWCWLPPFRSEGSLLLTSEDKQKLLEMYPLDWPVDPPSRWKGDPPPRWNAG
jgi:hypothetical protein